MSGPANHRPTKPLDAYPVAEGLPPPPPVDPGGAPAAASAEPAPPAFAALDFLDPAAISTSVDLAFGFRHEGLEVRNIPIRRLTVNEVGTIVSRRPEGAPHNLYAFLEVMTGFPEPVLRGLIDDDGAEVLRKARPFLSRDVATMFYSPTSEAGEPTPSPQPEG